jgi:hypothetical protein
LIYFFDNCISYRYAEMLRALEVETIALRERFPENFSDVDLFAALGGIPHLVFITCDTSQSTRRQEARALQEARITALFLGPFWGKMLFWPQAVWLVTKWQRIDGFASNVTPGTCADIKQNGAAMVFPP